MLNGRGVLFQSYHISHRSSAPEADYAVAVIGRSYRSYGPGHHGLLGAPEIFLIFPRDPVRPSLASLLA